MKLRAPLTALAVAALSLGCPGEGGVGNVLVVANVEVTPNIAEVILGKTQQLSATPKTSSGIAVTGRSVTWTSTNTGIAQVTAGGLVTGMGIGGPVIIRATVEGVIGDAVITVRPVPIDHVTVEPPNANVQVGLNVLLVAKAFDANNVQLTGRSFLWESSDHSIATVTTTGTAIGVKEGGPVTITATSEGKSGTASVSVSNRPATRLGFSQQPGLTIAGQAMVPPVQVELLDNLLIKVVGAPNPVTIAIAGNPGGSTLSGQTTVTPSNGVATFTGLSLNKVGNAYTFLVTSPGLQSATSDAFNVIAGLATQLAFTTTPSAAAQSGVALGQQPVLQLRDNQGNNVNQANVVVTASIASGPAGATLGGTPTATTNAAGVASFTNLSISGTAGSYTLSFAAPGATPLASGPIVLSAGAGAALFIATPPSSTAQSNTPLAQQPAIQLKDGAGNNVSQAGVTVSASIATGGGAVAGGTSAVSNAAGLAVFAGLAISGPAGTYTLSFTAPAFTPATSGPIVLGAGAQTKLSITTQPAANATSGAVLVQQPVAQLLDASNNPVASAGVAITATVSGAATLSGTVTKNTGANGAAVFTDLAITGPAGPYTLTFTSPGLTSSPASTVINLAAGAATRLSITRQPPSAAVSGVAFAAGSQPIIQIVDAAGNAVNPGATTINAVLASGPAGGTLGGAVTAVTAANGAATFANLTITGPSGSYTLQFTATGLAPTPVSGSVTLGAGAPTTIAANSVVSQSATVSTAVAAPPSVKVTDGSGNPVAGVTVAFAVTAGGGTVAPASPTTVNTNALGIATATSWTLGPTAGTNNNTVTATSAGLTGSPLAFTASGTVGAANMLAITTQPVGGASGAALTTQPVIAIQDAQGNAVITDNSTQVTVAIFSGAGGTLGGTQTVTAVNGVATFTNVTLAGTVGVPYVLRFTSNPVLTAANSNNVTVTVGTATQLTYNQQPSTTATSGAAFATQPKLLLRDGANNPVGGQVVTATITGSPAGVSLVGTTTATTDAVTGIASFANLGLSGTPGTYSLTFTANAGALSSGASNNIVLSAGAGTQLTYNQQPSTTASSGAAFGTQPKLLLQDASNNPVGGQVITATITAPAGGATLIGTVTATTDAVTGIATFAGLGISGPAANYTLTFTANAGALSSAASNTIALSAGTPTQLTYNQQPSTTATSGDAFGTQPKLLLQDAANNPVGGQVITATITAPAGTATLVGTVTATTDAVTGIATFTDLGISGPIGTYTLTFTANAGALSSAASNNIALSAGTATQLTITTEPAPASPGDDTPFTTQPTIQIRDGAGNPVPTGSPVTITAELVEETGTGTLGGTLTAGTNPSGAATFTDLKIKFTTGGTFRIKFTSGSLAPATSIVITVP